MYEFEQESRKKAKGTNTYIVLFVISFFVNLLFFLIEGNIIRSLFSFGFFLLVLVFGLRKKLWALIIIKYTVWLHLVALVLLAVGAIFK